MTTEKRKKFCKSITGNECNLREGLAWIRKRIRFNKKVLALAPGAYESLSWREQKKDCRIGRTIKMAIKKQLPAQPKAVFVDDYNCYTTATCACGFTQEIDSCLYYKRAYYCSRCGQKNRLPRGNDR